ncbi:MAG: XRE family transcriptional regulator [Bacteroidaceae bacterium]|nr:XRE family transcriptional regulator [Bacteroidaceae bacterium]
MEDLLIQRIKSVISDTGLTDRQFALKIGFNYNTLNNYLIGKRVAISTNLLTCIISTFGHISATWLLTGEGSMLKSENLPSFTGKEGTSEMDLHAAIARKTAECEELQKENTKLLAQLEFMEDFNMRLQKKYLTLENKLSDREKIKVV